MRRVLLQREPKAKASGRAAQRVLPETERQVIVRRGVLLPYALVVLSMDDTQKPVLKSTLDRMDLAWDSRLLSANDEDDRAELLTQLNRRPMKDAEEDDGEWEPRPQSACQSMAVLLIAHFSTASLSLLTPFRAKIIRWIEHGGIVLVHGMDAPILLGNSAWFGKREWHRARPPVDGKSAFNADQQVGMASRVMFPPDASLPKALSELGGKKMYLTGVVQGEAMYASLAPAVCPVALSRRSEGLVGFLGGADSTMINIAMHLANRVWIPAEPEDDEEEQAEGEEEENEEDQAGDEPQEAKEMKASDDDENPEPPASSFTLVVLSFGAADSDIPAELDAMGLTNHYTVLNLRDKADCARLKELLSRPPLIAPPEGDDSVAHPAMSCLLLEDYLAKDESQIKPFKAAIVRWVESGGMLMVHGSGAAKLLHAFGKEWKHHRKAVSGALLNADQLSPQRGVKLLPSTRDRPLRKMIGLEEKCLVRVDRGDAVYSDATVAGAPCSVVLSSFGPSNGRVGFIGGLSKNMLDILVQLVNRQWTPAAAQGPASVSASSAAVVAPSHSPAAAAASSSSAAAATSSVPQAPTAPAITSRPVASIAEPTIVAAAAVPPTDPALPAIPSAASSASVAAAAASATPHVPTAADGASRSAPAEAAAASSVPSKSVAASSAVITADSSSAPALSVAPPKPTAAAQESRSVDVPMVPAAVASLVPAKPIAASSAAAVSALPQASIAVVERPAMDAQMLPVAAAVPIAAAASSMPPALPVVPAAPSASVVAVPAAASSALAPPVAAAASAPHDPLAALLQAQQAMMLEQQALIHSQQAILQLQRQAYESTVALQAHLARLTQQRDSAEAKALAHEATIAALRGSQDNAAASPAAKRKADEERKEQNKRQRVAQDSTASGRAN